MKILFLDDSQVRVFSFWQRFGEKHEITACSTAQEAIDALENDVFDIVCLDHDLGGKIYQSSEEENCGMTVAKWIVEDLPPIKTIFVHSWNIPAAKRMWRMLYEVGYEVIQEPFSFRGRWVNL